MPKKNNGKKRKRKTVLQRAVEFAERMTTNDEWRMYARVGFYMGYLAAKQDMSKGKK